eukprot:scaffold26548_cov55-Phaeocystis_antarctica.AAC.4
MPNAQCPMPNAQCPMPNAQCHPLGQLSAQGSVLVHQEAPQLGEQGALHRGGRQLALHLLEQPRQRGRTLVHRPWCAQPRRTVRSQLTLSKSRPERVSSRPMANAKCQMPNAQ